MRNIKRFHHSGHSIQRMLERGLSEQAIKDTVKYAEVCVRQRKGENGGIVYRCEKSIEGRLLVVAAEIKDAECWLLTAFFDE